MRRAGSSAPRRSSRATRVRRFASATTLQVHLRVLASLIRDAAALASGAPADALTNADLAGELEPLAATYGGARAVRAFQAVERALAALESNASPKIVPDWLALQL